ncbi:hypothetical protein [Spirosoma sp.]|uniref:hypothetical protein n=1 Tax=Spirosoma sp. TaxID=1899569 RepID=UPI002634E196|nr:hypothetical protein [Spirosoma sp.]MCX6217570.1 hypothetical protein [Spirosoma sp.]
MKSPQDIEELKRDWRSDPCWDIEVTEGFEDHHDELLAYRKAHEAERSAAYEAEVTEEMASMGITNRSTYDYLKKLETNIDKIFSILERRDIY